MHQATLATRSIVHEPRGDGLETTRSRASKRLGLVPLMRRYAAGDDSVYPQLMARIQPVLRDFLGRRLKNAAEVDDLVQTVLLRVHRGRARFEVGPDTVERSVTTWFVNIAKFAIADYYRITSRRARQVTDELDVAECICSDASSPEDALLERERAAAHERSIRLALDALSPEHRELIVLHKLHGMPMISLATKLGVRPGTLRVRAHRAYRSIARQIRRQHRLDTAALRLLGATRSRGRSSAGRRAYSSS